MAQDFSDCISQWTRDDTKVAKAGRIWRCNIIVPEQIDLCDGRWCLRKKLEESSKRICDGIRYRCEEAGIVLMGRAKRGFVRAAGPRGRSCPEQSRALQGW
jgi:hypothetical protein